MTAVPLLSVAHCNVNCTDLARSRAFYEGVLGLAPSTRTNPEPQDGTGFGIPGPAAWDAWMLHDHRGAFTAPVVDLLQWLVPTPVGVPYPDPGHPGLAALRFVVPSVDTLRAALEPDSIVAGDEQSLSVLDPDGVRLSFRTGPVEAIEFRGVTVNCTDLGRSRDWYERVLGLETTGGGTLGAVSSADLALPDQAEVFTIALTHRAGAAGRAYASAHHLGIFRMAFMVDDIDAGYELLRDQGVSCFSPPVTLDMGPQIPIDGLRALFFPDPDGACLELIETIR